MKKTTIVAAVLIAGTAVTAFAHSGATGIVKERMDAMLAMGKAVKTVAPMMRAAGGGRGGSWTSRRVKGVWGASTTIAFMRRMVRRDA